MEKNKNFTWRINELDPNRFSFNITFEEPSHITLDTDFPDTLVFTFREAELFLIPEDQDQEPLNDGY